MKGMNYKMNQILSVEMPKKKLKKNIQGGQTNKANTRTVVIFFSIVLLIFGIALIGISLYTMIVKNDQITATTQINTPRIDVTQNAAELEIEISCETQISSIEYNWEGQESQTIDSKGKNKMDLTLDIPSGTNIFTMKVTDVDGKYSEYSKEYVGAKEPNITTFAPKFDSKEKKNIITISCEESQIIKFISYSYDEGEEKTEQINDTTATIKIEALEGEHKLSIKVGYQDGTVGKISKNVYFPTIKIETNGTNTQYTKFIINASDLRTIDKAVINFNGVETVEQVNQDTFSKEIDLVPGEPGTNKLIITIYNKDGMSITKRVWDINRQN